MKVSRLFSGESARGIRNYLNSQKKYEVLRTILYFGISASLFVAGYLATGEKLNMLTIVAVLGCLPACKSMVGMIMFLRFKSCPESVAQEIEKHAEELEVLYDMVFTTYDTNYCMEHMTLRGNTVICYCGHAKLDEGAFLKHMNDTLALDGIKNITFKVFYDLDKYTARMEQLKQLEDHPDMDAAVKKTLLSVAL